MRNNRERRVLPIIIFFLIATFVIVIGLNASMGINVFKEIKDAAASMVSKIINNEELRDTVGNIVSEATNTNYGYVNEQTNSNNGGILNNPKTEDMAMDALDSVVKPATGMTFDDMVDSIFSLLKF